MVDNTRIVVVHPVNIRPYLYLLSIDSRPDQGSAVVAPSPLQIVDITVCIPTNKSLGDKDRRIGMLIQQSNQLLSDINGVRFPVGSDTHEVQRWQKDRLNPLLLQVKIHHAGGDQFSLRQYHLLVKNGKRFARERPDMIEMLGDQL